MGSTERQRAEQAFARDGDTDHVGRDEGLAREVGRGRSARTPFVLFFGVNLALLGLALAIALLVLLALLLWRLA
jgi:hypothetical protein